MKDGETILLDGGSTTLEVARCLVGRSLQVVTNSLPIASLLSGYREIDLVMVGGYVYPKTGVALGPIAALALERLHVNRLIMGVAGLTERGLFNGNLLLVETEQAMMKSAQEVNVVADTTKFGQQGLAFLTDWSAVHRVVVDDRVTPLHARAGRERGSTHRRQENHVMVAGNRPGAVERVVRQWCTTASRGRAPTPPPVRRDWWSTSPPGTCTFDKRTSKSSSARAPNSRSSNRFIRMVNLPPIRQ